MARKLVRSPVAGDNNPDPVAQYKAQVEGKLADIQLDTQAIESALSGQNGYEVVTTRNVALRPSLTMLTRWDQDGDIDGAMNTAIVSTHNASGAQYTPAIVAEFRLAKFIAVHAADVDTVNRCRFKVDEKGNVLLGVRARGNVPAHDYGSDKALLNITDQAQANDLLVQHRDAAAKALAALGAKPTDAAPLAQQIAWRNAERVATMWNRAEPTVEGICYLADVENSAKQGVSLFRRRLLVDFGKDRFDQFKSHPTTKPIYNILDNALGHMMSAQKKWYRDHFTKLSDETDEAKKNTKKNAILKDLSLEGDKLQAAMADALDVYLKQFETAQVKAGKDAIEVILSRKLWAAAKACEKHFDIPGEFLQTELMRLTSTWRDKGLEKPKMTDEEKTLADLRATAVVDARANTRAAAADVAKTSDGDAAKRQAELDKQAAKEAADKQNNAPTPAAPPVTTGNAAAAKLGRRGRAKAALPA
jgi:hypothetical protein